MKKYILILSVAFLMVTWNVSACVCARTTIVEDYQSASFAALVRIIKITPDSTNALYKDLTIEMVNLYKGKWDTKISLKSDDRSSCRITAAENTTWLIFAQIEKGRLSFGACSGSGRMDNFYDPIKEPIAAKNYMASRNLELRTMELLKKHRIVDMNPSKLNYSLPGYNLFDGFKNANRIGLYRIQIKKTRAVGKVKALEKFSNPDLNAAYIQRLKTDLRVGGTKYLDKPTVLYVLCYYYGSEVNPGFLRYWNL